MARVDVIIPVYNASRYVAAAIESVMAQTFSDWKIVFVDDGSTDNSAAIIQPYLEKLGPKAEYIRQSNGGVSSARNTGIRASNSEFVAMLDADDIWLPCRLSESLRVLEAHPEAGLSYGYISRIDADSKLIDTFDKPQKFGEGFIAPYLYMRLVDLPTLTVTVRRKCLDDVGLFDQNLRVTEDRDLWFRVALRYEIVLVRSILAHYRMSPTSITTDPDRMLKAQSQFIEKHYGAAGCGFLQRRIALSRVYKQRAEELATRGNVGAAFKSSLKALALYPMDLRNVRTAGSLLLRSTRV